MYFSLLVLEVEFGRKMSILPVTENRLRDRVMRMLDSLIAHKTLRRVILRGNTPSLWAEHLGELSEVREGVHVAESATITVAEAGKLWLTSGDNDGLERTTLDQRRQHLQLHIVPLIGREKLSKISVPTVRA